MQRGKEEARVGMSDAWISPVPSSVNVEGEEEWGVENVEERWLRIGVRRSSSSSLGRPLAVS